MERALLTIYYNVNANGDVTGKLGFSIHGNHVIRLHSFVSAQITFELCSVAGDSERGDRERERQKLEIKFSKFAKSP